ncbi:MAG: beta-lactamase family protein, partial [Cephaloticoccus sp.]|nr:beta-lactamase family protein [Cephaloticoccus sp.]
MSSIQQHVQNLLDHLVAAGKERGIQVTAYHEGKLIVDAWAGIADVNTGVFVTPDTLFPVFSVTKGLVATVVHRLVERGLLTYETCIAAVWPEFGVKGKEGITVGHVLRHTAGITKLPRGTTFAEALDWEGMCRRIAALAPEWDPGMRCAYHGLTYGWILGEVMRRVSGLSFNQLVQEEICAPLGIDGMFVSLPSDKDELVAWLEAPDVEVPVDDGTPQVVPFALQPLHTWMNRLEARRACLPAANGIMNARSLARHYAALLPGGVNGVELLPAARINEAAAFAQPARGVDGHPHGWGLGYLLGEPGSVMGEVPTT